MKNAKPDDQNRADTPDAPAPDAGEILPIPKKGAYLPYPTSTLSPKIVPNDLTTFRSRGASQVEKELQQKLQELKEEYERAIDDFNWNKLIYEADFSFEPVMGDTYHLYMPRSGTIPKPGSGNSGFRLSLIPPGQWPTMRWVGSFRLNLDRRWEPTELADDFDMRDFAGTGG